MNVNEITLGTLVKLSHHPEATVWMVKRIDTTAGKVWLVDASGSGDIYGWVSAGSIVCLASPTIWKRWCNETGTLHQVLKGACKTA